MDVRTPGLAVAAGATVVEKHLTLDRSMEGPDHEASLEPDELAAAVDFVETAATVRGDPEKRPTPSESANVEVVRKSIHAANDLSPGTRIDESDLVCHRPATGLSPREYDRVVGSTVLESVDEGEALYDGAIDTGS